MYLLKIIPAQILSQYTTYNKQTQKSLIFFCQATLKSEPNYPDSLLELTII